MLIDVNKTTVLEHPSEAGVTFVVRSLRGTEMDEAADIRVQRTLVDWGETLEAIQKYTKVQQQQQQEDNLENRVRKYDGTTLLKYALVGWSYSETVTVEQIQNLDAVTRQWLVEEVVKRNTRPLPLLSVGGNSSKSAESLTN